MTTTQLRVGVTLTILATVLTVILVNLPRPDRTTTRTDPTPPSSTRHTQAMPSTTTAATGPAASTGPAATGHDDNTTVDKHTHDQILATATQFLLGWTTTDPQRRHELLTRTATPRLATPLLSIPTHRIPTQAPTHLQVTTSSHYAATVTATNPNTTLVLVADPPSWRVDDIIATP